VSKATHCGLLALTVVAILAGCGKKETPRPRPPQPPRLRQQARRPPCRPTTRPPSRRGGRPVGIAKADGGKTVAEVFAEKDALAGKPVAVRGKVVKVNAGIMGKNWLHVRDGSGAEGTNDLTVTTAAELPALGATVVVIGRHAEQGLRHGLRVRRDRRGRRGQGGITTGDVWFRWPAKLAAAKERPADARLFFRLLVDLRAARVGHEGPTARLKPTRT